MTTEIQPLTVKKSKVPELLGVSYSKFINDKFQKFLKERNFPKPIETIGGYVIKDITDWLDSINPNKNKSAEVNRSWD